jgi:hypothetical protein
MLAIGTQPRTKLRMSLRRKRGKARQIMVEGTIMARETTITTIRINISEVIMMGVQS